MARRSPGDEEDYEPDWTEEELEEKLAEVRARRGRRPMQVEENNNDDDDDENINFRAVKLAKTLRENGDFAELEELAKCQVMMDPDNAKDWRLLAKRAAKQKRRQRPLIIRLSIVLLKIIAVCFGLIIAITIIGAFFHH